MQRDVLKLESWSNPTLQAVSERLDRSKVPSQGFQISKADVAPAHAEATLHVMLME